MDWRLVTGWSIDLNARYPKTLAFRGVGCPAGGLQAALELADPVPALAEQAAIAGHKDANHSQGCAFASVADDHASAPVLQARQPCLAEGVRQKRRPALCLRYHPANAPGLIRARNAQVMSRLSALSTLTPHR